MGLDGASAPSKFLSAPSAKLVYYIYLTSTTRLVLRRSMNIKLINRTRASKIDMDEIVDKFDKTGDRRIPMS